MNSEEGDDDRHLLIHGSGDDNSTWTPVRLTGPITPIPRKSS